MRGGYQIIDLKGINHTIGVGMMHEGIWDLIEGTPKTILLTNIQIADTEYRDTFVDFTVTGSAFVGTVHGKTLTIQDTDAVTFTNA